MVFGFGFAHITHGEDGDGKGMDAFVVVSERKMMYGKRLLEAPRDVWPAENIIKLRKAPRKGLKFTIIELGMVPSPN